MRRNPDDDIRKFERAHQASPENQELALKLYVARNRAGLCAICAQPTVAHAWYDELHKDASIKLCIDCRKPREKELLQLGGEAFAAGNFHALYGVGAKRRKGYVTRPQVQDGLVLALASLAAESLHAAAIRMYHRSGGRAPLEDLMSNLMETQPFADEYLGT